MSSFKIPKGKTYSFSITVLATNSYLPRDLTSLDLTKTTFSLVKLDTMALVPGVISVVRVPDDKLLPSDPITYCNGRITVTIPNTITSTLEFERGSKLDDYYIKPTYQGVFTAKFTDSISEIVAIIPSISVVPTGV